jgi:hypothetical protein
MKKAQFPAEIQNAIAAGFVIDDSLNDVRVTGELSYYDHNGNPDNPSMVYRLWDDAPDGEIAGMRFEVYDDGRVESDRIDANGAIL